MTNLEKFIQIMNTTFDAGFTPENMVLQCSPCGGLKKFEYACQDYDCEKCSAWWNKEYSDMTKLVEVDSKPLPVKRCKVDGIEQDTKERTVKQWFQKINEELDEFKREILVWNGFDWVPTINSVSEQKIMEEAMDTITAITSMLEAMGIDEEQRDEAQRLVNEKNWQRWN